jgi:hypothetical protein
MAADRREDRRYDAPDITSTIIFLRGEALSGQVSAVPLSCSRSARDSFGGGTFEPLTGFSLSGGAFDMRRW